MRSVHRAARQGGASGVAHRGDRLALLDLVDHALEHAAAIAVLLVLEQRAEGGQVSDL
jgi:hypothetical protein